MDTKTDEQVSLELCALLSVDPVNEHLAGRWGHIALRKVLSEAGMSCSVEFVSGKMIATVQRGRLRSRGKAVFTKNGNRIIVDTVLGLLLIEGTTRV